VVSSGDGQRDMLIRDIALSDAGLYTARDEFQQLQASANLTVIGPQLCFFPTLLIITVSNV